MIPLFNINKTVCNYISTHWIAESKSNRDFARIHNISEGVVRKILKPNGYKIPLETIATICYAKNLTLKEFFSSVNETDGEVDFSDHFKN